VFPIVYVINQARFLAQDVEELMLMEAIRRSMLEEQPSDDLTTEERRAIEELEGEQR
jgi:hypothetical protein